MDESFIHIATVRKVNPLIHFRTRIIAGRQVFENDILSSDLDMKKLPLGLKYALNSEGDSLNEQEV